MARREADRDGNATCLPAGGSRSHHHLLHAGSGPLAERRLRRLPALTDLLDVRDEREAADRPVKDAVSIPFAELGARTAELPSNDRPIRVAAIGPAALNAVNLLKDSGRDAVRENTLSWGGREQMRLWPPNPFFIDAVSGLSPGKAIDFACGAGRDSVA